jgi:hypothetical protein
MKIYDEKEFDTLWHGNCLEVKEWLPVKKVQVELT